MDLLIKHGTWVIVPIGLALSFVFLIVAPKVYPFLAAWGLNEEDARDQVTYATYARPKKHTETGSLTARRSSRAGSHV